MSSETQPLLTPVPAPSDSGAPVAAIVPSLVAPPLSRRMACWIYEGVLMFGVVWIAGYLFGTLSQTRNALDNRHALQAFLFVVFAIYFVWLWAKGQTLAMKTWRIQLVDAQGGHVSQTRAFVRYLLAWIWFLPPLALMAAVSLSAIGMALVASVWVLFWAQISRLHPQKQFWHDAWAGTRLVAAPSADGRQGQAPSAGTSLP